MDLEHHILQVVGKSPTEPVGFEGILEYCRKQLRQPTYPRVKVLAECARLAKQGVLSESRVRRVRFYKAT